MKKLIILNIALLTSVSSLFAQQNFQVSQYYKASNLINPALSGINQNTELTMGFRKQWSGFDGSPRTFYINGHTGIQKSETKHSVSMPMHMSHVEEGKQVTHDETTTGLKQGIGGYAYSDKAGYLNRTSFGGTYAIHYGLTDDITLSGGASVGLTNFALDQSSLTILDETNDAFFNSLGATNNKQMSLDLNLGFMLYTKNWFFGYSGMQFLGNKILDKAASINGNINLHHNFLVGYKYEMSDDMFIMANVLAKKQGPSSMSLDVNAKFVMNNKYWGGLGVRSQDALVIFLGSQLTDNISLNYSYDLNTRIGKYTSGGHEIVLGATLGKNIKSKDNYVW